MLRLKRYFLWFFLLIGVFGFAQLKTVTNKTTYPFWIQVPEKQPEEKLPLLLFLHGKSLSGTDINRVKRYGVLRAIEKGRKIPAIVVAPQLASGSWNPDKVLELIEYLQKNYPIDEQRIYVCGMSLGGYGTLHFAGKHPDKLTAAVAICGGGNEKDGCRLATVPLWIQHGDVDYIVPLSESQKMYDAIKKCNINADVTLTVIKGGNHGSVERLFHQDELYEWLFKQVRKE
ncbi:prolyl oligopeptidase family serine peptidase [Flavobacterium filum]|nr:prolyl oligopeptidase family serine peptidase [Flavobacterium filum]